MFSLLYLDSAALVHFRKPHILLTVKKHTIHLCFTLMVIRVLGKHQRIVFVASKGNFKEPFSKRSIRLTMAQQKLLHSLTTSLCQLLSLVIRRSFVRLMRLELYVLVVIQVKTLGLYCFDMLSRAKHADTSRDCISFCE